MQNDSGLTDITQINYATMTMYQQLLMTKGDPNSCYYWEGQLSFFTINLT